MSRALGYGHYKGMSRITVDMVHCTLNNRHCSMAINEGKKLKWDLKSQTNKVKAFIRKMTPSQNETELLVFLFVK